MNATIIAAIIGLIGTTLSPILVHIVKNAWDNRNLHYLSKERRRALSGKWEGKMYREIIETGETDNVSITILWTFPGFA